MIIKRQNMSENKWNHFKIVPQGHNHCQLSIVNFQFGEAAKFLFIVSLANADTYAPDYNGWRFFCQLSAGEFPKNQDLP